MVADLIGFEMQVGGEDDGKVSAIGNENDLGLGSGGKEETITSQSPFFTHTSFKEQYDLFKSYLANPFKLGLFDFAVLLSNLFWFVIGFIALIFLVRKTLR